jgi:RimJ/RimL family protein N-acetyltransferase
MNRSMSTRLGAILLREASPTDAAAFRELRLGGLQDSPVAFSADYQKNLSEPLKFWEDRLTMHPDEATIFFAEYESNLVGMTGIARGSSPKTRHTAWVWGVYVIPDWRGLHIAEELIRDCLAWAKARKIVTAKLGVAAVNTSAIRCYERCGFKIYATEPRALYVDGQYYDFHMMYCDLDVEAESKEQHVSRS